MGLGTLRLGSKLGLLVVSASLTTQISAINMKGAMTARAAVACQLRIATSTAAHGQIFFIKCGVWSAAVCRPV